MNHEDALIAIAIGVAAIITGMGKKGEFYALGPGQRPKPDTKPIPRWFGRLWFVGGGGLVIYWSVPSLGGTWRWSDLWVDWWLFALLAAVWVGRTLLYKYGLLDPKSGVQTLGLAQTEETSRRR